MTITITLTSAGSDSGPFDIYGNSTGSFVLITSGVSKLSLTSGYNISVPDGTTVVRVQSTGTCTNYQDIPVQTTTTTVAPTTAAPTTQPPGELCFYYDAVVAVNDLQNSQDGNVYFVYTDCNGVQQTNAQSNEGTWTNAFCATGFTGTYILQNNIQMTGISTADYTGQACGNV